MDNSVTDQEPIAKNRQNLADYNLNRNAVSIDDVMEEIRKHSGQFVARSLNGIDTYVYASSYEELYQALERQNIALRDAVVARVPDADETLQF